MKNLFYLSLFLFFISCQNKNNNVFDITNYGANGNGRTLNTVFIQKAIDEASKKGGKVLIPKGVFLTGTLFLKSNIVFYLDPNAVLLGSSNIKDYTEMTWGHHEDRTPWHLIMAKDVENISIEGQGIIDGNGKSFWENDRKSEWHFYKEIEYRPSPMVEIENCKNVIIRNVSIKYSAGWDLHLLNSSNIKINAITIENDKFGPNTDGIDITGCKDVLISDCNITCGDDGIALKTTEDSKECENITVTNCIIETNCVAFRIGYESRKDFRNITFSNCIVKNCSRVIDIRSFEGANIEHINISNIVGQTNSGWVLNRVIEIDLDSISNAYGINIKEHPNYGKSKIIHKLGYIRNVSISNLDIRTDGRIMIATIPEGDISNVYLSNINLEYAMIDDPRPFAIKAKSHGFFLEHPDLREARAALVLKNLSDININNIRIKWPSYPIPSDWNLLQSPHRFINAEYYKGNEEKIKSGEKKPSYNVLWAKNISKSKIDISSAQSSEINLPKAIIINSTIQLIQ